MEKNKFPGVLLGISYIDSALSAVAAVDALGLKRHGVMTSPYTSKASLEDAKQLVNLGIRLDHLDITPAMQVADMLTPIAGEKINGVPTENINPRPRVKLMALSGATGKMVLTTGNKSKSRLAMRLYMAICGGYSVLKDVYKTQVMAEPLAQHHTSPKHYWLCPEGDVIPTRIITRPIGRCAPIKR